MEISFTQEGLEKEKPHLLSQLRKLNDTDLETIRDACNGRTRTRNRSMLVNLEYCGRKIVRQLWEFESGRKLVELSAEEVLAERRGPVDVTLWRNHDKLA